MSWADCKRLSSSGSGQCEWYSLYPPPHGRALEQEESRNLEREKNQTDCNVEHKGFDSDSLLVLAHPCLAVEKIQNGIIVGRVAATGHDDRCPSGMLTTSARGNSLNGA